MIRRGLTLIEVLVSVVLMTMLAVACVPLLQRGIRLLGENNAPPSSAESSIELQRFAREILESPDALDFDLTAETGSFTLDWPEHLERASVRLELIPKPRQPPSESDEGDDDDRIEGRWLKFSHERQVVYRWIALPDPDDQAGDHP